MKLFVANIAFAATQADLEELFRQIGPLKRVHLVTRDGKSRGFGFVEFLAPLDAARALNDLHGKELMGRRLIVQESNDGPRSS
jgi:RNA recognition motif-containing protein